MPIDKKTNKLPGILKTLKSVEHPYGSDGVLAEVSVPTVDKLLNHKDWLEYTQKDLDKVSKLSRTFEEIGYAKMKPIQLVWLANKKQYELADGFHRMKAAIDLKLPKIMAEVYQERTSANKVQADVPEYDSILQGFDKWFSGHNFSYDMVRCAIRNVLHREPHNDSEVAVIADYIQERSWLKCNDAELSKDTITIDQANHAKKLINAWLLEERKIANDPEEDMGSGITGLKLMPITSVYWTVTNSRECVEFVAPVRNASGIIKPEDFPDSTRKLYNKISVRVGGFVSRSTPIIIHRNLFVTVYPKPTKKIADFWKKHPLNLQASFEVDAAPADTNSYELYVDPSSHGFDFSISLTGEPSHKSVGHLAISNAKYEVEEGDGTESVLVGVAKNLGCSIADIYFVKQVEVRSSYRSKGFGQALYLEAVKYLAKNKPGAWLTNDIFAETSDSAKQVWTKLKPYVKTYKAFESEARPTTRFDIPDFTRTFYAAKGLKIAEPSSVTAGKNKTAKKQIMFAGLPVGVEYEVGDLKKHEDGTQSTYWYSYGFIKNTKAPDGGSIDVYLGWDQHADNVYVVKQLKKDGTYDEDKVMLGFPSEQYARNAYLTQYPLSFFGGIRHIPSDAFKSRYVAKFKAKTE